MMTTGGPDFLCVGMQKAGTGWLYDQLQFHPDFWMAPVKEFHYFDREFPSGKFREMILNETSNPDRFLRKRKKGPWRPLDERDSAFFEDVKACAGTALDLGTYAMLFRHKGDLLSGDITPAYSTLKEDLIAAMAGYFPRLKILLMLRDPVSRAWSQANMLRRRKGHPPELMQDPVNLRRFLNTENVHDRSFATEAYKRWARHVDAGRIRYFFLDDIVSDAAKVRREILLFLGADPEKASGPLEPSYNRKSDQDKMEMSEPSREVLVAHFAVEIKESALLFGGAAHAWTTRYGL